MKVWRRLKAWWKRNEYRGPDGDPNYHGNPGHGQDSGGAGAGLGGHNSAGWG